MKGQIQKNEIAGIVFKYQFSLLARQPYASFKTERLGQTMQVNSVPLGCANFNYPSALSDMPPSRLLQRP